MACQCGCSTGAPGADSEQDATSGCGCATTQPGELDVASLARLVKELDQRVRQLEHETTRA